LMFFSIFAYPIIYLFGRRINRIVASILNDSPPSPITKDYIVKYKFKFTNIQAAIGLDQLKTLDALNNIRIENAIVLTEALKKMSKHIRFQQPLSNTKPIYLNYVVQVPERARNDVMQKMRVRGVDIGCGFLSSCASMKEFQEFKKDCPISDEIVRTNLYIPIQPPLESKHMEYIVQNIAEIVDDL